MGQQQVVLGVRRSVGENFGHGIAINLNKSLQI
jgi:hypothetical protein